MTTTTLLPPTVQPKTDLSTIKLQPERFEIAIRVWAMLVIRQAEKAADQ